MESQSALIEQSFSSRYSLNVREALDELPENFTVTDPSISGHPIVFASRGFLKMCGYSRDEVIGRNGRIFQGPRTHRRSVMQIREAIREERTVEVNLLNYRKDGTPFWMLFRLSPIFSKEDGTVTHFIAVQIPILRSRRGLCGGNNSTSRTNGENLWEAMAFSSCRRELCSEGIVDLCHALEFSPIFDSHTSEPCEANEVEKRRAASAIDSILSLLTHSSEMTGRLICGKKSSCFGTSPLGSSVTTSLGRIKQSFVLTDVNAPDMPIVYASNAFFKLTGYSQNEVLGRNCRFLSGADTDTSTVHLIKDSVQTEKSCTVRILNYRKDGSSFWNLLHISPIRSALGKIAYFVGVQMDESSRSHGVSFEMRQKSTVGGVRVALRTLSMAASCSST